MSLVPTYVLATDGFFYNNPVLGEPSPHHLDWIIVEQDRSYDRDPFESLAISYRNLKAMGLS